MNGKSEVTHLWDKPKGNGTPIFICGMERSGTSLVANIVHRWGAFGGRPKSLAIHNEDNPTGYYENFHLQVFLRDFGLSTNTTTPDFPERLKLKTQDPFIRQSAQKIIDRMLKENRVWFWKMPVISVLIPFWKTFFQDIVFVIPVRHPYSSAVSFHKHMVPEVFRPHLNMVPVALMRWQYFMHQLLSELHCFPNKMFIHYEALLQNPEQQCQRISDFLDQKFGVKGLAEDRVSRMAQAVRPELNRNKTQVKFDDLAIATDTQKKLYRHLQRLTVDPDLPFEPENYPYDPAWQEHYMNFHLFLKHSKTAAILYGYKVIRALIACSQGWYRLRTKFKTWWYREQPEKSFL